MEIDIKKVGQVCRTCLCVEEKLYSIYDLKDGTHSIYDMLAVTVPQLHIEANDDELPRRICDECYEKLIIAFDFHQLCIASDKRLLAMLNVINNDPLVVNEEELLPICTAEDDCSQLGELECDPLLGNGKHIEVETTEVAYLTKVSNVAAEIPADNTIQSKSFDCTGEICEDSGEIVDNNDTTSSSSEHSDYMKDKKRVPRRLRKKDTQFSCEHCPKKFKQFKRLAKHQMKHQMDKNEPQQHSKPNKIFICEFCNKAFSYNYTLKQHVRTHTGEKPYLCAQCGISLTSESALKQHLIRHTDQKDRQCPECPSKFLFQGDLTKHMTTHRGTKPYVCNICGSSFTRSYSLKQHLNIHSGKRPYKCDQCGMTFVFIHPMLRHMRTHTGEKPYKCKFCNRSYAASGDLNKHLRTHVGENTYMCTECPQAFKYKVELRDHQNQHYKEQQQQQQQLEADTTKGQFFSTS